MGRISETVPTPVMPSHINGAYDGLDSINSKLGAAPQGEAVTLTERLAAIEAALDTAGSGGGGPSWGPFHIPQVVSAAGAASTHVGAAGEHWWKRIITLPTFHYIQAINMLRLKFRSRVPSYNSGDNRIWFELAESTLETRLMNAAPVLAATDYYNAGGTAYTAWQEAWIPFPALTNSTDNRTFALYAYAQKSDGSPGVAEVSLAVSGGGPLVYQIFGVKGA